MRRAGPVMFGVLTLSLSLTVVLGSAAPLAAQSGGEIGRAILDSQRRLEQIREERARLQAQMDSLRSRVRDASLELQNIERQLSASRSVLAELDYQTEIITAAIDSTNAQLAASQERLAAGRALSNRRLRDVYKRGPLHSVRVLLGAESFGDLLTRYRYLRIIADFDRDLVSGVEELQRELRAQGAELQENLSELGRLRQIKLTEVAELRAVESARERALQTFQTEERSATSRLARLVADEQRLTGLIVDLEERRRENEARNVAGAAGAATLTPSDAGRLPWPVQGEILYPFGRQVRPDGTVLPWNGIGIDAPPGSPVQAVQDGVVEYAGPFEGYGPTVILSHGGGFYTLYLYLEEVGVVQGREIEQGQVVGTVGGQNTPEGPHLEFQIWVPGADGSPAAQNPMDWLRSGGG